MSHILDLNQLITLWSRLTIVFRIRLQISWSSLQGTITLESISSSSGFRVSGDSAAGSNQPDSPCFAAVTSKETRPGLTPQFLHQRLITTDVLDRHLRVGKLGPEVVLGTERGEESVERIGERGARVQERLDGISESARVFENLFRPSFDGGELPVEVVKLWVAGL